MINEHAIRPWYLILHSRCYCHQSSLFSATISFHVLQYHRTLFFCGLRECLRMAFEREHRYFFVSPHGMLAAMGISQASQPHRRQQTYPNLIFGAHPAGYCTWSLLQCAGVVVSTTVCLTYTPFQRPVPVQPTTTTVVLPIHRCSSVYIEDCCANDASIQYRHI